MTCSVSHNSHGHAVLPADKTENFKVKNLKTQKEPSEEFLSKKYWLL